MDSTQFGGTFWITIAGMTLGFLATAGIYCLKAKCNQISLCWGLVKIQRDVDAEVEENANAMEHGINPYQFQTQNFNPESNNNQYISNPMVSNSNTPSGRYLDSNLPELPSNTPNNV
jgi:hypothetical protein